MSEDLIHLLPDSVANQIAAGEVIQRPASVVKELVENAVDAGASTIHILLTDAGRTNIQVIDDGKGMSETDARLAFERHATSKIQAATDLFSLATFGFRGEALASIAAVAQVEVRTRREGDELGTVIHIAGSTVEKQEMEMCPVGTNMQVKNLFFNVPARRKFLKSNQTEMSNIMTELERIALVNPTITFTLHHNETEILNLPQVPLLQRIQHLFGKKMGKELLPIDVDTTVVLIKGYVGTPESARKKGVHNFFFVNGRYMRHPYFHKAVMEAYEQLIPATEQIPYFLYLTVDPARIDVNIHPTKTEIKFEEEQVIWQILMASVREVLGRCNAVPSIDFDTADCPDIPIITNEMESLPQQPEVSVDQSYNPFNRSSRYRREPVSSEWNQLYQGVQGNTIGQETLFRSADIPVEGSDELPMDSDTPMSLFTSKEHTEDKCMNTYQYKGQYIVTSMKSGLMLVNQHRAHVRVLYDRYMRLFEGKKGISQGMLFPEMLQVPMSQSVVMEGLLEDFASLGFDISNLGGGSFAIQGIPSGIEGLNVVELVNSMLSDAIERGEVAKNEIHGAMALTMARSAAIVVGQVLSNEEMTALVDELFACEVPAYTPDGKSVFSIIGDDEIERRFA